MKLITVTGNHSVTLPLEKLSSLSKVIKDLCDECDQCDSFTVPDCSKESLELLSEFVNNPEEFRHNKDPVRLILYLSKLSKHGYDTLSDLCKLADYIDIQELLKMITSYLAKFYFEDSTIEVNRVLMKVACDFSEEEELKYRKEFCVKEPMEEKRYTTIEQIEEDRKKILAFAGRRASARVTLTIASLSQHQK